MEKQGAPQQLIDELKQAQVVEVLPQNWPIVSWWCEVSDLMRYSQNGACLGLDLLQVKAESELSSRQYKKEEFNGLRVMSKEVSKRVNQG